MIKKKIAVEIKFEKKNSILVLQFQRDDIHHGGKSMMTAGRDGVVKGAEGWLVTLHPY